MVIASTLVYTRSTCDDFSCDIIRDGVARDGDTTSF